MHRENNPPNDNKVKSPWSKILVVGDGYGVPELLERVASNRVLAIIAAENRPQYHSELQSIAIDMDVDFFIQPHIHNKKMYDQFISNVEELDPDSLLCHSYSMLIRPDILQLVKGRAFNIHASLLPKNRGPNPVQWALIHGEDKTGVTLHVMDEGIDSGAIVDQEEVEIVGKDTWVTLMDRVKKTTHRLMNRALPRLINGELQELSQDMNQITTNQRITQESFAIDFLVMTDKEIFNLIRAQVSPLAGAYIDGVEVRRRFPDYLTMDQIAKMRMECENNA